MDRSTLKLLFAFAAFAVVTLAGCTVRDELSLDGNGAGEGTVTVSLNPIMLSYMSDLMATLGNGDPEPEIFNIDQIRASFADRPGVDLVSVDHPDRGTLTLHLTFTDVSALFAHEGVADVISLSSQGANRVFTLRLDRNAVQRFLDFAPPQSATMAQFLFPPADGSMSLDDYRDQMAWTLGEYADADRAKKVLDDAKINVQITPKGKIVSQQGGTVSNGSVTFSIPVLELLTLSETKTYSLVFAP